jgi:hypothetical protein
LVLTLLCKGELANFKSHGRRNVLRSSVRRAPRERRKRVEASRSEPN